MSFRPDGYRLLWEAETVFGDPMDPLGSRFLWQEAATKLLGDEWFAALNRPSKEFPGLELLIEQDGSTAYVIDEVLTHWAFVILLGGDFLPLYFCSPNGTIMRTFLLAETLTPFERVLFWKNFDPTVASIEDFVAAFMGANDEKFALISSAGLVQEPPLGFMLLRKTLADDYPVKIDVEQGEIAPFVGWSVCVRENDLLRDASALLSILLSSRGAERRRESSQKDVVADDSQGKRPSGRPSLQSEIVANFRNHFKDGRGATSISEVARVLGYDRKTTRKALKAAGELGDGGKP